MRIAVIASVAHACPPRAYGPWELIAWLLAEGLAERGHDVTLFATANSSTTARLGARVAEGYEESDRIDARVATTLHVAHAMERAWEFDVICNQFDFHALAFARMTATPVVTTIHGFSSEKIVEVYREYDAEAHYVSISEANRHPDVTYSATIHHGIPVSEVPVGSGSGGYLVAVGRVHPDKGTHAAIDVARASGWPLFIAGTVHDHDYYRERVAPHVDGVSVHFLGNLDATRRDHLVGGAAALLHPIGFDEPFGLAVVESLAVGTPVIAFDRGSMPELIDPGRTGFLVRDVDQAVDAVREVHALDRRACRHEAERRFSVDRMVDDYERLFQDVIDRSVMRATAHPSRTTDPLR